eukprot:m.124890 g.124890  ORF g.124890 m.124890 type:complete len:746 (-) comp16307_c0_seq1:339-2576(-)
MESISQRTSLIWDEPFAASGVFEQELALRSRPQQTEQLDSSMSKSVASRTTTAGSTMTTTTTTTVLSAAVPGTARTSSLDDSGDDYLVIPNSFDERTELELTELERSFDRNSRRSGSPLISSAFESNESSIRRQSQLAWLDQTPSKTSTNDNDKEPMSPERALEESVRLSMAEGLYDDDLRQKPTSFWPQSKKEFRVIVHLAWPMTAAFFMELFLVTLNTIFIGNYLSSEDLAAAGLSLAWIDVVGFSLGFGLASAVDTLGSQGTTSKNPYIVGLSVQRGFIILSVAMLPCICLFAISGKIFEVAGLDPIVAQKAGDYVYLCSGMLPGMFYFVLLEKYLHTQNAVKPPFFISGLVVIISVPLNFFFFTVLEADLMLAAHINTIQHTLLLVLIVAYMLYSKVHVPTWPPLSFDIFGRWQEFVMLGLSVWVMLSVEWWSLQISEFVAGMVGTKDLVAQVVSVQVVIIAYMGPAGLADAASIHVGQLLGAGNDLRAAIAAYSALAVGVSSGLTLATIIILLRAYIPQAFTSDEEVLHQLKTIMMIAAAFHVADSIQGVCSGVLRGCGRQKIGIYVSLIGFWVIGVPMVYFLVFHLGMGSIGLWTAMCMTTSFQAVALLYLVVRTDWESEVSHAERRTAKEPETPSVHRRGSLMDFKSRFSRWQLVIVSACLLTMMAGFLIRFNTPVTEICYPLPDIANADTICGEDQSVAVGHSCHVECASGFNLVGTGVLECFAGGVATFNASCVPI